MSFVRHVPIIDYVGRMCEIFRNGNCSGKNVVNLSEGC